MNNGTPIRFTADHLGVMVGPDDRFCEPHVMKGMTGNYVGPHPNPRLDGWHLTTVTIDDEPYYCPVMEGQFEAVTAPKTRGLSSLLP